MIRIDCPYCKNRIELDGIVVSSRQDRNSDIVNQFYIDSIVESKESMISWKSLFDAYEFYCNEHDKAQAEKIGYKKFNRLIKSYGIVDCRPALDEQRSRCWKGISLKSDFAEWMLRKQNNK